MDIKRVGRFTRMLAQAQSRRGFVGLGIVGIVAGAGVNPVKAKKFNRCRRVRCPECAPCRKGHCRAKPDGSPCSSMTGQCLAGFCEPVAEGPMS